MFNFPWRRYWSTAENWFRLRAFYTAYEKMYALQPNATIRFCQAIVLSSQPIPLKHRQDIVLLYFTANRTKANKPIREKYGLDQLATESRLLNETGVLKDFEPEPIAEDEYAQT